MTTIDIAIIGAGPRGTVILERICANAALLLGTRVHVHVIDPFEHGPGRVWRRDQPHTLLMNSVASDITAFLDHSVRCEGPVRTGPNMYQWAKVVANELALPAHLREEADRLRPWSYSSRALHGEYLRWAFQSVQSTAPTNVDIRCHRRSAISLVCRSEADGYEVQLGHAASLRVDAVVLTVGHYPLVPSTRAKELSMHAEQFGIVYVPPGNAADADLSQIRNTDTVILFGMGLTFFDYVSLLTIGRGGKFETVDGELAYRASGAEPQLYAASRQGLPFRARADSMTDLVFTYQPRYFTAAFAKDIRATKAGRHLRFRRDIWPVLQKEIAWAYYSILLRDIAEPAALATAFDEHRNDITTLAGALDDAFGPVDQHLDWEELLSPCAGKTFDSPDTFGNWVEEFLVADYWSAVRGPQYDAGKAVSAAVRDARSLVRQIVSYSGISGDSYHDDIELWFNGLNNMIASGPPRSRIAELIALRRAGLVEFVGPAKPANLDRERGLFAVRSEQVTGSQRFASCLIEAYLPGPDVRRAADHLLAKLLADKGCRPYRIPSSDGSWYESGGLEVDEHTLRVLRADGRVHANVYCFGPPTEGVQWVTASGARPGVNSQLLVQADLIARTILTSSETKKSAPREDDWVVIGARARGAAARAARGPHLT